MASVEKVTETATIKFTEEEIKKIEDFKNEFGDLTARFGEIEIETIILENQITQIDEYKTTLKTKYIELRDSELKLANELKDKYGEGEFDTTSGLFTPKQ